MPPSVKTNKGGISCNGIQSLGVGLLPGIRSIGRYKRAHLMSMRSVCSRLHYPGGSRSPSIVLVRAPGAANPACRRLLENGTAPHDVQDSLSHADPRTTRRYDRARNSLAKFIGYDLARALA